MSISSSTVAGVVHVLIRVLVELVGGSMAADGGGGSVCSLGNRGRDQRWAEIVTVKKG